jgi:hypothetical protein
MAARVAKKYFLLEKFTSNLKKQFSQDYNLPKIQPPSNFHPKMFISMSNQKESKIDLIEPEKL